MGNNPYRLSETKMTAIHDGVMNGESQYDENGVDVTLVRWMLSLTPAQRLDVLQKHIDNISRLLSESR